jgi:hypothetical protein
MVTFYVFSLVLGGGFLGLSLLGDLFGGHGDVDLSSDVSLDTDMSMDTDVSLDTDVSVDTDVGFDAHLETDAGGFDTDAGHAELGSAHLGGGHGGDLQASQVAAKIFSIRTITYSLFGFGAVGTLLTYVFPSGPGTTAAFAVTGGLLSGALINAAFTWVKRSESGQLAAENSFSGHSGRVTLPIAGSGGKIVVEHLGKEVELRALPHPSALTQGDPAQWRAVVVVEMDRGVALVAPVSKELLA